MSTPDGTEQEADDGRRGVRVVTDAPRQMVRVAWRDPEHICERLTLQAVHRLAEPSLDWAQATRAAHPDGDLRESVTNLGTQSARIARLQGMVAGTPFHFALVPGYMNYLWQEARMTLRLAALYDRDPGILENRGGAAVATRGVSRRRCRRGRASSRSRTWACRPSRTSAGRSDCGSTAVAGCSCSAALLALRAASRAAACARGCGTRPGSLIGIAHVGGHLDPPGDVHDHDGLGLRDPCAPAVPAHACVLRHRRAVRGRPARAWPRVASPRSESGGRRSAQPGLALSIAIPAGFLAYALHVRHKYGITWVSALGLLVALSVVTAGAVYGSRR